MKKAFVSTTFAHKLAMANILTCIREVCDRNGIQPIVFVEDYRGFENDKAMMHQTFKDIESCDFLIADLSFKSVGVGIEIGYARALKKPTLYLRKTDSEYSQTAAGTADFILDYSDTEELNTKLDQILKKL